jgi:hypothetical protein
MTDREDDGLVLLVAAVHTTAEEALARRKKARELLARARRIQSDYDALRETAFTTTLAKTKQSKRPPYVRRWPGVYGEPS